jgi:hypothetical protein
MGRGRTEWGLEVPGGFVTTKIPGGLSFVAAIVQSGMVPGVSVAQDIVIQDETRTRELFREGPYSTISVDLPLRKIVAQIESVGLDEFLRRRQIENAQIGPVTSPTGRPTYLGNFRAMAGTFIRRFR